MSRHLESYGAVRNYGNGSEQCGFGNRIGAATATARVTERRNGYGHGTAVRLKDSRKGFVAETSS